MHIDDFHEETLHREFDRTLPFVSTRDGDRRVQRPRLLIVPGLHDSGPEHWQSWLERMNRGAVRVRQDDWTRPDLDAWAGRIEATIACHGDGPWLAVAHSFGCLALARHLQLRAAEARIAAALFVAPAEPDRFGVAPQLPQDWLSIPATLVASETDPWMTSARTREWATRWGCHWVTLGDAGHINVEAGFGSLPLARRWIAAMQRHISEEGSFRGAASKEWTFAV